MNAKLADGALDAAHIRTWVALGYTQAAVAREYGITSANVRLIVKRLIWKPKQVKEQEQMSKKRVSQPTVATQETEEPRVLGYHLVPGNMRLNPEHRDDRAIVIGETLSVTGNIRCCNNGLHASIRAIDTIKYRPYAKELVFCRVEVWGDIDTGDDKIAGRNRRVLWVVPPEQTLRVLVEWAMLCAKKALDTVAANGHAVDPRSYAAIEATQKWLNGEITIEELATAAYAAAYTAYTAYTADAADAAAYAADAAARAADAAARAADAAAYTADAAAYTAAHAAAHAAAYTAAHAAAYTAAYTTANTENNTLLEALLEKHAVYEMAELHDEANTPASLDDLPF